MYQQWDYDMEVAPQIAMDYLDRTGQTPLFKDAQISVVKAIAAARKSGVQHRIKLADTAIKAVEREREERPFRQQGHG
jgi:hypothetical protein